MAKEAAQSGSGGPGLRYQQVYDLVLAHIEREELRDGDRLPSSAKLAEMSGVSLISVRRALDDLVAAGRIVRQQGVGTFVASRRLVAEPAHPGALLETLTGGEAELKLTTQLLSIVVGVPSGNHVEALGIEPDEPVWEVTRLRLLGGVPKVLEEAVLPLSRVPGLAEDYLAIGGSLYAALQDRYGLSDDLVEQSIVVDRANVREREPLRLERGDHVVRIRGVSFTAEGIAFDSYQQTYPAREFVFYTSGSGGPRLLRSVDSGDWTVRPLGTR